jgi:hypothetical protein
MPTGLLLIPQALMFSTLAGVPMIEGLWAAWLPGLIYTIMGTSKGLLYFHDLLMEYRILTRNLNCRYQHWTNFLDFAACQHDSSAKH